MGTFHMQATIPYIEEAIRDAERHGKPQDYVTVGGEPVSFEEAYAHLAEMRAAGYELVPCCDNVDERGRCKGTARNGGAS